MGCFPQRNQPQYKPLDEQETLIRRAANPNKSMHSIYVPIQVNQTHTDPRPFNKVQRTSPKKTKVQPVSQERLHTEKFSRKQASVMRIDNQSQKRINRKRTQDQLPTQRKRGKMVKSPPREHIISSVQTPSQSAKTSLLANMESNPSIFFVKMNEKDLDSIFNKAIPDKQRQNDHNNRYSYKSLSPYRVQKQSSA